MLRAPWGRVPAAVAVRTMSRVVELEGALQMEPAAFRAAYFAEKPARDEKHLVFFCQIGKRGSQATQLAQDLGYTGAHNYSGAYREWLQNEG
ncbi:thiosulfate:glutathione sulfurtransferase isoform X2 [Erinaceus europaeus]|uniref:Thiosulfate:glutathione sulfurtransferase isoform X2 n=1 Tax=Erinaceus europaeus TaxID=9365 RepID=A0A1S3WU70_ERIEU|nr:thiosulfate:glutathione sulfurtransferase isoform X2 [Erinaceus europaeus]